MSSIQNADVPGDWQALIANAWTPYGRRASTLGSVYSVVVGGSGSDHDRFVVRKLLEGADPSLLFSAIIRSAMGYGSLAVVAESVGACAGENVATIRKRAERHGDRNRGEMAGASPRR